MDDWSVCVGSTSIRMPPTSVSAECATSMFSLRIDASARAGAWSKKSSKQREAGSMTFA